MSSKRSVYDDAKVRTSRMQLSVRERKEALLQNMCGYEEETCQCKHPKCSAIGLKM
jgi:hypothetical protein